MGPKRQRHCATCQCTDERRSASERHKNRPSLEDALAPLRQFLTDRAAQPEQDGIIEGPPCSGGAQQSENGSAEQVDGAREDGRHDTRSAPHSEIEQTNLGQGTDSSRHTDYAVSFFATKTGLPSRFQRGEEADSIYSADDPSFSIATELITQPGSADSPRGNINNIGEADSADCGRNDHPVSESADILHSNDNPAMVQTGAKLTVPTAAGPPTFSTLSSPRSQATSQETVSDTAEAPGDTSTDDSEYPSRFPSSACSYPDSDVKHWLITEAQARRMPAFSEKAVETWIKYASLATVSEVMQNLQSWIRLARQHQMANNGGARKPLELLDLLPAGATTVHEQVVALAARTLRDCEHATMIGGQASFCLRLCYANLYRLNMRARAQNAEGWGFRGIVFDLCYPEFASGGNLRNLDGAARTALNRLTGNIHFGGAICRFVDLSPCVEAVVLLHPDIPNRFLQRLTAAQMDLWADLVYHLGRPTSECIQDLWKATAMVINHNIDLQTYWFPLERVRFNGTCYVDVETQQLFEGPLSQLLTPVLVDGPWPSYLDTNVVIPTSNAGVALQCLTDSSPSLTEFTASHGALDGQNIVSEFHEAPSVYGPAIALGTGTIWDGNDEFGWAFDLCEYGEDNTTTLRGTPLGTVAGVFE